MGSKRSDHFSGDGANPGKIFVGGLAVDTKLETFRKHFEKYGEITDHVIIKDRQTGQPRGFGFITYKDPTVVDKVIKGTHVINGKQVGIERAMPKGAPQTSAFKPKKTINADIPKELQEELLKIFHFGGDDA